MFGAEHRIVLPHKVRLNLRAPQPLKLKHKNSFA